MTKYNKKTLYWCILIAYTAGTLFLTIILRLRPVPPEYKLFVLKMGDVAHFILLGGFAFLALWGLNLKNGKIVNWGEVSYWTAFLSAFFFGVFIEFLQSFTPTRKPCWHDVLINGAGIVFVLIATRFYSQIKALKRTGIGAKSQKV